MTTTKDSAIRGVYTTADRGAQIEWELEPKENGMEFSASGTYEGGGGQCIDKIAATYPKDAMVQRIAAVWQSWHLNGMKSGTPEQAREIERRTVLAEDYARKDENAKRYFYDDGLTDPNWHSLCRLFGHDSFYSWECAVLREAGLYEVPLPKGLKATGGFPPEVIKGKRGYRFGERWVFAEIPAEVIAEIRSWDTDTDARPLQEIRTDDFIARHHIEFSAVRGTKLATWQPSGHHYKITLAAMGRRLSFDFWDSQANAEARKRVSAGSVISCIASDIDTPATFEDFCAEYGAGSDSRKALATFKRCAEHADRLRAFFTEDEQTELRELRG